MTVSVICVGGGEGKEEGGGVREEGGLLVSGWWRGCGKHLYYGPHVRSASLSVTSWVLGTLKMPDYSMNSAWS